MMVGVLYNLRSAHNTAACFRTADGIGMKKIYLVGTTPEPVDRFGRKRADFKKVSLGAEDNLKWEREDNILNLIDKLKRDGFKIVAVEQDEKAVGLFEIRAEKLRGKMAVIVGSETLGIEKEVLEQADLILEIPMAGEKESLNVAVAFGVAGYGIKLKAAEEKKKQSVS